MSQRPSRARKLLSFPIYLSFGFSNCTKSVYRSHPNMRKKALSEECLFGKRFWAAQAILHSMQDHRRHAFICMSRKLCTFSVHPCLSDNRVNETCVSFQKWKQVVWTTKPTKCWVNINLVSMQHFISFFSAYQHEPSIICQHVYYSKSKLMSLKWQFKLIN